MTAFIWYAFGGVPLQVAVAEELGLHAAHASSWIFIVWFSGALSSVALSLYYRQPIPITWTIPGLVFLGTLAGRFPTAELVGANIAAGVIIVVLGALGVGGRIMTWLPLPIVMGMFAGSILRYVTALVRVAVEEAWVVGPTVLGYLLGRMVKHPRVPPVGLAAIFGGVAAALAPPAAAGPMSWSLPVVMVPEFAFSVSALISITFPLVVLAMGLGNVQGLGFLLAQGYRVPIDSATVVVGIASVINGVFGGYPATVARTGSAILASADAGPPQGRYWANLIASLLTLTLALSAAFVVSLVNLLPQGYILALAGLAILSSLQDAFEKAFIGTLRFGALIAFIVAASPFTLAGITSEFWAIPVGLVCSLLVERRELVEYWRIQAPPM